VVLPKVCIVTAEDEFLDDLSAELSLWFQLVTRDSYDDLARWTREADVAAVLLDIDTQGEDAHGGLAILNELRKLNEDLTLISLRRSRTRAVEKQANAAGADAHFRNPVDLSELRMTLVDTLRRHAEGAAREQMRRQAMEVSRFQDFVGASDPMRMENLIESELFGSERGAFTGATEARPGQIELADGGTLSRWPAALSIQRVAEIGLADAVWHSGCIKGVRSREFSISIRGSQSWQSQRNL
jgi:DNA-binding NtrC family response regulator